MLTRRTLIGLIAATPLIARPAFAATPETYAPGGIALGGTDPVGYFTDAAPVQGSADHALMWRGAAWHFASAESRASFEMNPLAYAPHYGGYCAYAMAQGAIATTDPAAWTIHEGQLYLNFSVNVRQIWSEDIPGNITKADSHWPAILNG
jgi:hypothetical protein